MARAKTSPKKQDLSFTLPLTDLGVCRCFHSYKMEMIGPDVLYNEHSSAYLKLCSWQILSIHIIQYNKMK